MFLREFAGEERPHPKHRFKKRSTVLDLEGDTQPKRTKVSTVHPHGVKLGYVLGGSLVKCKECADESVYFRSHKHIRRTTPAEQKPKKKHTVRVRKQSITSTKFSETFDRSLNDRATIMSETTKTIIPAPAPRSSGQRCHSLCPLQNDKAVRMQRDAYGQFRDGQFTLMQTILQCKSGIDPRTVGQSRQAMAMAPQVAHSPINYSPVRYTAYARPAYGMPMVPYHHSIQFPPASFAPSYSMMSSQGYAYPVRTPHYTLPSQFTTVPTM